VIAWVDGRWVDADEGRIPIDDRGFLYGDGVYDTCRLFEGRWFRFDEHARRLHASGEVLGIEPPPRGELRRIADDLAGRNPDVSHGTLRMTVTRGSGGPGRLVGGPPRVVMTIRPLPEDWRDRARRGWRCMTATVRHPPASVMPPGLKGQGRISSLLAALEAEDAGCDQALLLSTEGIVTEGTTWNVFWRAGDVLRTPAESTGLLAGVTRALVLEIARGAGYAVETGAWERGELDGADEVFATMTSLGLVPILSLDGRALPEPRRAVDRLAPLYWDLVRKECHG
jgi:branched-chain amino acid aminotransferase